MSSFVLWLAAVVVICLIGWLETDTGEVEDKKNSKTVCNFRQIYELND